VRRQIHIRTSSSSSSGGGGGGGNGNRGSANIMADIKDPGSP